MADYHKEILECCKKLRLSSNLADRSIMMERESHQEYLYRLLDSEMSAMLTSLPFLRMDLALSATLLFWMMLSNRHILKCR